jgi:predicted nucleic acid-binding Zn finger protein
MLLHAKEMTVWANNAADVSAWEVVFPMGRFTILISPEVSRGFSGEGQMLERLASGTRENSLPQVKAALRWQARIDAQDVCARFGLERTEVESALAVLGSRGLVGYDLARRAYFHRELPFDMGKVESLHPRLLDARKLVEEKLVRLVTQTGAGEKVQAEAYVQGSDVEHRVRLRPEGDICTCPWYGKHQGDRGPCKHVLAVRLLVQGDQDDAENTD